jgi:hypothetical protein
MGNSIRRLVFKESRHFGERRQTKRGEARSEAAVLKTRKRRRRDSTLHEYGHHVVP